jgi:hypothetical protein
MKISIAIGNKGYKRRKIVLRRGSGKRRRTTFSICIKGRNDKMVRAFRSRLIVSIDGNGHCWKAMPRNMNDMRNRISIVR